MACAVDRSNLPVFNSAYGRSDIIVTLMSLNVENPEIAINGKMLLALLSPLLNCEQIQILAISRAEAKICISRLKRALEDPNHMAEDCSILTILNGLIWLTHEYHNGKIVKKNCSNRESQMIAGMQKLTKNIEFLVEEGLVSVLTTILKLKGKEEVQATAARLVWSLAHVSSVKMQIYNNHEIVAVLNIQKQCNLSSEFKTAVRCVLHILDLQTNGK